MFNQEWWKLPMQIAVGLLLCDVIRAIVLFLLRAVGAGRIG